MINIDDNTVGAESENDLRSAISNTAINYIYLATNITMTSGITIPANKASLVIDGEYPINSGNKNEFTDMNSSLAADTIGIRAASSIALTFRNMVIHGYNYYGVPYIVDSILYNTDNVSVTYENVSYTGPQIIFNRHGMTRFIDSDIIIDRTGTLASEEVGEVNRVELGGRTTIRHRSLSSGDDFAVFWFLGNTATMSLTVLENAQVEIVSENCYFMYNMDSVWGIAYPVPYVIQPNASFQLTVNKGLSYDYRNQISSFLVNSNASFRYIQTANNGTNSSLYINGALTVNSGAQFYMQAQNSTEPLIQFTNGTGRSLNVQNPLSFVLYCGNDAALISAGTTQVSLTVGQLNTWSIPQTPAESAGTFEDLPEFKWHKLNYVTPLEVTGSFTQSATTVTANLQPADLPYDNISNLHLHSARVISMGDWPIMINPIEDNGNAITGSTQPNANIRVIYDINLVTHTINGTALENGRFTIETSGETPQNIPAGTVVSIWSNIPFLIKETETTVIEAGALSIIEAPAVIVFNIPPISTNPLLLPRVVTDVYVLIEDNRSIESRWELSATITGPLHTDFGDTLPDGVVFVETAGGALEPLGDIPVVVYTGGPAPGTTRVSWLAPEGLLVHVTQPLRMGAKYYTTLNWELHTSNAM